MEHTVRYASFSRRGKPSQNHSWAGLEFILFFVPPRGMDELHLVGTEVGPTYQILGPVAVRTPPMARICYFQDLMR